VVAVVAVAEVGAVVAAIIAEKAVVAPEDGKDFLVESSNMGRKRWKLWQEEFQERWVECLLLRV
jgi:hypothetical protein